MIHRMRSVESKVVLELSVRAPDSTVGASDRFIGCVRTLGQMSYVGPMSYIVHSPSVHRHPNPSRVVVPPPSATPLAARCANPCCPSCPCYSTQRSLPRTPSRHAAPPRPPPRRARCPGRHRATPHPRNHTAPSSCCSTLHCATSLAYPHSAAPRYSRYSDACPLRTIVPCHIFVRVCCS